VDDVKQLPPEAASDDTKQLPPPDAAPRPGNRRRLPGNVYSEQLLQRAITTEKMVGYELRKTKRMNFFWKAYSGVITVMFLFAMTCLVYAIPLIRILPIFFWARPDGVIETALTTESLPDQMMSDLAVQTFLWKYVLARESYSWTEQDFNNYIVQAMSSVPVREAYQKWSSGKNPQSYQATLGKKGVIRVAMTEVADYHPSIGGQPGSIRLHYSRKLHLDGEPDQPEMTYTVSMAFIKDFQTGLDINDIRMFNPFRIVITEYPGAYPLSAKPVGR